MLTRAASLLLLLAFPPADPPPGVAGAIRETISHYFLAGDTASSAELKRAFHPSAMMFSVGKDGNLAGVSQPEWWARLDANRNPTPALSRKITILDVEGPAAVALVLSEYTTFRFEDYMTLLEIGGSWKIVGKVFHRTEGSDRLETSRSEADAGVEEAAIRVGLSGRDAAEVPDRRAMAYWLEAGELVGVSLADGGSRTRKAVREEARRVVFVNRSGNAALARVDSDSRSALRVDYVSLVKLGGTWRVVGVVSAPRAAEKTTGRS